MTEQYPILRFFKYSHLPEHLQAISKPFHALAHGMVQASIDKEKREQHWNPETEAGLRRLLEAKDCFVRAAL